jgi:polysaccharide export outer membrane protein
MRSLLSDVARRGRRYVALLGAPVVLLATGACAHGTGPFVWVDQIPERDVAPVGGEYRLGPGDVVTVQVFSHAEMSGRTKVRDDGKLSIPLLGDVVAAGLSPSALAHTVETELGKQNLAVGTRVTVALEERAPLRVSVIGEVARPGLFALDPGAGVAEALASAGGFTEFAHRDRLFVVRRQPELVRIRLTYDDLVRARGRAAELRLRPSDVVVVE